jgi:hypothetical protein
MALARCILGKFLGVGCHCFPPPLDVPTFVARCLHVRNDSRDPGGERWNCGRKRCPVILPKWRLARHLGIFHVPQIYDTGPTALLPLWRKARWGFLITQIWVFWKISFQNNLINTKKFTEYTYSNVGGSQKPYALADTRKYGKSIYKLSNTEKFQLKYHAWGTTQKIDYSFCLMVEASDHGYVLHTRRIHVTRYRIRYDMI